MSEIISITEGGRSRNFGPANLLETETADGTGSCFWVPESARELESEYIIANGDYTPEKYAYSDVTVNVVEPIGDFDVTIDDIDEPHIDIDVDIDGDGEDENIDLTIDPNTGLPDITIDDVEIDLPDISADIDINGDLDVSLDVDDLGNVDLDISGVDLDCLDVNISIDLNTLDIDVTDLPDEIRIMHVPNKTSYKDGEEIDLDGLVVQAYRGGEVWQNERYVDGYIPVHELNLNPQQANSGSINVYTDDFYRSYSEGGSWPYYEKGWYEPVTRLNFVKGSLKTDYLDDHYWIRVITEPGKDVFINKYKNDGIFWYMPDKAKQENMMDWGANWPWQSDMIRAFRVEIEGENVCIFPMNAKDLKEHILVSSPTPTITIKKSKVFDTGWVIYYWNKWGGYSGPEYELAHLYAYQNVPKWRTKEESIQIVEEEIVQLNNEVTIEGKTAYYDTLSFSFNPGRSGNEQVPAQNHNLYFYGRDTPFATGELRDIDSTPRFPERYQMQDVFGYYDGYPLYSIAWQMLYGNSTKRNDVIVSWPRPHDNKLMTASFDITVEESEGGVDSSGTHYSGKFDESPSGHFGGTTISGDFGGSHHSGKF